MAVFIRSAFFGREMRLTDNLQILGAAQFKEFLIKYSSRTSISSRFSCCDRTILSGTLPGRKPGIRDFFASRRSRASISFCTRSLSTERVTRRSSVPIFYTESNVWSQNRRLEHFPVRLRQEQARSPAVQFTEKLSKFYLNDKNTIY